MASGHKPIVCALASTHGQRNRDMSILYSYYPGMVYSMQIDPSVQESWATPIIPSISWDGVMYATHTIPRTSRDCRHKPSQEHPGMVYSVQLDPSVQVSWESRVTQAIPRTSRDGIATGPLCPSILRIPGNTSHPKNIPGLYSYCIQQDPSVQVSWESRVTQAIPSTSRDGIDTVSS